VFWNAIPTSHHGSACRVRGHALDEDLRLISEEPDPQRALVDVRQALL